MGKFVFNDPPKKSPVRIEQVFAEKPGGGVVHVEADVIATTPVKLNEDGTFEPVGKDDAESTPVYVTGNDLYAKDGEYQPVRLINGANLRKETAIITEAQAVKMSGVHLV